MKTVSTFPPKDLFTKDAATIARAMESKKVSPKGIGSGIRMIQYFINRGGKGLSAARKRELEKAKRILQEKRLKQRASGMRLPPYQAGCLASSFLPKRSSFLFLTPSRIISCASVTTDTRHAPFAAKSV